MLQFFDYGNENFFTCIHFTLQYLITFTIDRFFWFVNKETVENNYNQKSKNRNRMETSVVGTKPKNKAIFTAACK